MDVATGLGIAKTSLDLIKGIREGLKGKKTLTNEEILGYVSDLQDRIIDLKTALSDADDENRKLKAQVEELQRCADIGKDFEPDEGVFWYRDYPYCPNCWNVERKPVLLEGPYRIANTSPPYTLKEWRCPHHKTKFHLQRIPTEKKYFASS